MSKVIDVLFEDPPINNQKFALVSIVGPNMAQKCNVWGLKIRGVTESIEKAKAMTQKLMNIDNNYDIYTVDVGKFFPLEVEASSLKDVEYENSQLNNLIKSYLENREHANEQWHARKSEMIKDAIKEGQSKEIVPEHPVSVLQRIKEYEERIKELSVHLDCVKEDLRVSQEKMTGFSEAEIEEAIEKIAKIAIEGKSDV